MVVVVVVATVVVVACVVETGGSVDVVAGWLVDVVVDMGENVDVVDASSPEAAWHPAARAATAAITRRERSICIRPKCYVA